MSLIVIIAVLTALICSSLWLWVGWGTHLSMYKDSTNKHGGFISYAKLKNLFDAYSKLLVSDKRWPGSVWVYPSLEVMRERFKKNERLISLNDEIMEWHASLIEFMGINYWTGPLTFFFVSRWVNKNWKSWRVREDGVTLENYIDLAYGGVKESSWQDRR